MQRLLRLFLFVVLVATSLIACRSAPPPASCTLPDGRVLDVASRPDGVYGVERGVVAASPLARFDRITFLKEGVDRESRKRWIRFRLSGDEARASRDFTANPTDRSIAVVVDGEVACQHKIRQPLSSDEVQISCCNPSACDRWRALLGNGG